MTKRRPISVRSPALFIRVVQVRQDRTLFRVRWMVFKTPPVAWLHFLLPSSRQLTHRWRDTGENRLRFCRWAAVRGGNPLLSRHGSVFMTSLEFCDSFAFDIFSSVHDSKTGSRGDKVRKSEVSKGSLSQIGGMMIAQ